MTVRSGAIAAAVALNLACWTWPASAEEPSAIGYPSVSAALEGLRADPEATERAQRGWTVFVRGGGREIWSFTPPDHPAHPSAAKRTAYQDAGGAWHVETRLLCQSSKARCDALVEEYRQLDEQMKETIQRERGPGA